MKISDTDVRQQVLTIFEQCRKEQGATYDRHRFLDHLVEPPAPHGQIKSSFSGNRRFVRFLEQVQTDFAVCFSQKDWETSYSVDEFVARIQELRDKPNGSLRSLKNSMGRSDVNVVIVANLLFMVLVALSRNVPWLMPFAITAWLVVNVWFVWFYRRERERLELLRDRITELKAEGSGHA